MKEPRVTRGMNTSLTEPQQRLVARMARHGEVLLPRDHQSVQHLVNKGYATREPVGTSQVRLVYTGKAAP